MDQRVGSGWYIVGNFINHVFIYGQFYRARKAVRNLVKGLLAVDNDDQAKVNKVTSLLFAGKRPANIKSMTKGV